MSKKRIVFGVVIVAAVTAMATLAGVYFALGFNQVKAANALRFLHAVRFIETQFVGEVDDERLINGAISGMMGSLGDPHSAYLDPAMYKELMSHTEGSFGGIGVVMGVKDKAITVISPIEGTPGFEAGIQTGDRIMKIDGEETDGIALDQAAARIRGEAGTKVVLTIRRANEDDRDIEITRSNIEIKTVSSEVLQDDIGYIRVSTFSEHTGKDVEKAYRELEAAGVKGFVLDLRNNPGGLLSASVDVGNLFVPKGPIVSIVKRDGSREEYESTLASVNYPLAVLVNGGSASASEIVAGAVQDTGAGVIVGTKSYGKGSVQVVMPMYGGDALKLTIAKYYTPGGRCIDGVGIEPDVKAEPSGGADSQLAKAIEAVREKIAE